jgi:hypothetical protein
MYKRDTFGHGAQTNGRSSPFKEAVKYDRRFPSVSVIAHLRGASTCLDAGQRPKPTLCPIVPVRPICTDIYSGAMCCSHSTTKSTCYICSGIHITVKICGDSEVIRCEC